MYSCGKTIGKVHWDFAALAIAIAWLGLFCVSNHYRRAANQEIRIQKVLGESVSSIVLLCFSW